MFLVLNLFNKYKHLIDSNDFIFVGSILHNKIGFQNKDINDIDISINQKIHDDFLFDFKNHINTLNLKDFEDYYNRNIGHYINNLEFKNLLAIDVFKNEHPINCDKIIYVFPNIYTKFFGYEWNLNATYNSYQSLLGVDNNERKKEKYLRIFKNYLNLINTDNIKNKELYNNIIKIINEP